MIAPGLFACAPRGCASLFFAGSFAEPLFEGLLFFLCKDSVADIPGHGRRDSGARTLRLFVESDAQLVQGDLFVAMLAPFLLAGDHQSCGAVAQPYGGSAAVDVLAARLARRKGLHVAFGEEVIVGLWNSEVHAGEVLSWIALPRGRRTLRHRLARGRPDRTVPSDGSRRVRKWLPST